MRADLGDTISVSFALVPFIIFLVLYSRVRWWRNPAGISTFVFDAVLVTVLSFILAWYLGWTPPHWFREAIYSLIGVAGWLQLAVFLRAQQRGRQDHTDPRELHRDRTV